MHSTILNQVKFEPLLKSQAVMIQTLSELLAQFLERRLQACVVCDVTGTSPVLPTPSSVSFTF